MRYLPLLALLFTVSGCSLYGPGADPDPGTGVLLWVAKSHVGGVQCTIQRYEPPTPREELGRVGVEVFAEAIEPGDVCEACTCPAYAATHYAEIRQSNVERAAEAGFLPSAGPKK